MMNTIFAWRLTFAYEGEKFTLKSMRKLAKRIPPQLPHDAGQRGKFVELRGVDRTVIYRRSISNIIPDTVEYRTGNPAQPLARVRGRQRRQIAILVPALTAGHSVALVDARISRDLAADHGGKSMATRSAVETAASHDLISVDLPREGGAQ